jgi:hypothetical protein
MLGSECYKTAGIGNRRQSALDRVTGVHGELKGLS